jgi:hypothetical protein
MPPLDAAQIVNKVPAEARGRGPFGFSGDARGLDALKLVEGWLVVGGKKG